MNDRIVIRRKPQFTWERVSFSDPDAAILFGLLLDGQPRRVQRLRAMFSDPLALMRLNRAIPLLCDMRVIEIISPPPADDPKMTLGTPLVQRLERFIWQSQESPTTVDIAMGLCEPELLVRRCLGEWPAVFEIAQISGKEDEPIREHWRVRVGKVESVARVKTPIAPGPVPAETPVSAERGRESRVQSPEADSKSANQQINKSPRPLWERIVQVLRGALAPLTIRDIASALVIAEALDETTKPRDIAVVLWKCPEIFEPVFEEADEWYPPKWRLRR